MTTMYIDVKLLNGLQRELTYQLPRDWDTTHIVGTVVTVPLQKRTELAMVTRVHDIKPVFATRSPLDRSCLPQDDAYRTFMHRLSVHHQVSLDILYSKIAHYLFAPKTSRAKKTTTENMLSLDIQPLVLTPEQQEAYNQIQAALYNNVSTPFLLHGLTGSGKTMVYAASIQEALRAGKSVLVLAPEIALAQALYDRFTRATDPAQIYCLHSATRPAQRRALWHALYSEQPLVLIGVHIPLLLPIPKLGLIIVDEEHEPSYQTQSIPYIHTRDAAVIRATAAQIPLVLGSATPSVTSWHCAHNNTWKKLSLVQRYTGTLPRIEQVLIERARTRGAAWWLTPRLERAIVETLAAQKQCILFLNRKGYSTLVQCQECVQVLTCTQCSVALVYHQDDTVKCHYCAYSAPLPTHCPSCKHDTLRKRGLGNQQVVAVLAQKFPHARIARADLDMTGDPRKWHDLVTAIGDRQIDIIVGTQTIAKGHHFPHVHLVGVIWADSGLHVPSYLSCEHTLQQLLQVAGRAGRASQDGLVLIQTMGNNPILPLLDEQRYDTFCAQELEYRQTLGYPPYVRFACIALRSPDEQTLMNISKQIAQALKTWASAHAPELVIQGPTAAPVFKIKRMCTVHVYLKGPSYRVLQNAFAHAHAVTTDQTIELLYIPNPVW